MASLPLEIILRIFQFAATNEDEQCEHSGSPTYWSCPLRTQEVLWKDRVNAERRAWNKWVTFRLLCRASNHLISDWMSHSAVLAGTDSPMLIPRSPNPLSRLKRFKAFSTSGCFPKLWMLLEKNSETIESFLIEMGHAPNQIEWRYTLPLSGLVLASFPRLTTFTLWTNAASEWFSFHNLVQLLRNSPQLKHLTIFQLVGSTSKEDANRLLQIQGEPSCQLKSLHIRRLRRINSSNLKFIVANSHQSLRQLTFVLERAASIASRNPIVDRGLERVMDICDAFKPCKQIETLRMADLVYDGLLPIGDQRRAVLNLVSPLSPVVEQLTSGLRNLQTLELCGTIVMQGLYNRHDNVVPFHLRSLSIDRYYQYRFDHVMYQLRRGEGPFSKLKKLALDEQVELDALPGEWERLIEHCQRRGVQLRIHRDDPLGNL